MYAQADKLRCDSVRSDFKSNYNWRKQTNRVVTPFTPLSNPNSQV
jgi:hypothetical protein